MKASLFVLNVPLLNKTIPVSHKPKEERRMMFICGDDIASIIKRFENESK